MVGDVWANTAPKLQNIPKRTCVEQKTSSQEAELIFSPTSSVSCCKLYKLTLLYETNEIVSHKQSYFFVLMLI